MRGTASAVAFTAAAAADLPAVDTAYRWTYGRYASIVDHLVGERPRAAALEVLPA